MDRNLRTIAPNQRPVRAFPAALVWCAASLLLLAPASRLPAAEWNTPQEGPPVITFVKMMWAAHTKEWWAWVTIEHEDWPIETHLEPIHRELIHPERSAYEDEGFGKDNSRDHIELRLRPLVHPYSHFVNWWVVEGPHGEKIHRRTIEQPHPGGHAFTLVEHGIKVPLGMTKLTFRAHCKLHGYGKKTITVDLLEKKGEGYVVTNLPEPPYSGRTGGLRRFMRSQTAIDQLGNSVHW